jgi:hypothetical protein
MTSSAVVNPFDFGGADEQSESKEEMLGEAKDMLKAAFKIQSQVKLAKKRKDHAWLGKLREIATRLKSMLVEFVIRAIELAVFKFIVELCAMIMNSIMDSLVKKGKPALEISTGGVLYAGKSASIQQQTPQQQYSALGGSGTRNDPFQHVAYGNNGSSPHNVAPW